MTEVRLLRWVLAFLLSVLFTTMVSAAVTERYDFYDQVIAAKGGVRYSRAGGSSGIMFASEDTLQAGLRDPALYGVRLTKTPTFNPSLAENGLTRGVGNGASVEIGLAAFSSRQNLIETIVHEETHIRLELRTMRGSHRSDLNQSSRFTVEAYVERVAERFRRRFGGR